MTTPHLVLSTSGARELVPTIQEATALAQRFSEQLADADADDTLITLDLSCRVWKVTTLQQLFTDPELLSKLQARLVTLKMDDVIASLPTDQGLATLSYLADTFGTSCGQLQNLHLDDNAVGTRGVHCLRPLLQNPTVSQLTMTNCGLAAADCATLKNIFAGSTTLAHLELGRNQMSVGGAQSIGLLLGQLPNLQVFKYDGSRPLAEGTRYLAAGLAQLPHPELLQVLDLNDCHLGSGDQDDDAVFLFCDCIAKATQLEHLNVRDCALDGTGAERVMAALQTSKAPLKFLGLGSIGDDVGGGSDTSVAVLVRNWLLETTTESSSTPSKSLLEHLEVDTNELGDDGTELLVATVAEHCPRLQLLNLECNEITADGARALINNTIGSLQTLCLEDNMDFPAGAARRLQEIYGTVKVDEELEEDGGAWGDEGEEEADDEKDAQVDALGHVLANVQI